MYCVGGWYFLGMNYSGQGKIGGEYFRGGFLGKNYSDLGDEGDMKER